MFLCTICHADCQVHNCVSLKGVVCVLCVCVRVCSVHLFVMSTPLPTKKNIAFSAGRLILRRMINWS